VPAFANGTLTLGYAASKRFLRDRAEARRDKLQSLASVAYGAPVAIAFAEVEIGDAVLREVWGE
jgi:hypothetical protein